MYILVNTYALVLCCGLPNTKAANSDEGSALRTVVQALQGGPITVAVAQLPGHMISRNKALQAGKRWTGVKFDAAHAWQVKLSDKEFMGALLTNKHCWLLEFANAVKLPVDKGTNQWLTLYAVVDARTGACWECFTAPQAAWWQGVKLKNAAFVERYRDLGESASAGATAPRTSFLAALENVIKQQGSEDVAQAKQIIARHFAYTTKNLGTLIQRVDESEIIPRFYRRPVWYLCFEGISSAIDMVGGGNGLRQRLHTEANVIVSAGDGQVLGTALIR